MLRSFLRAHRHSHSEHFLYTLPSISRHQYSFQPRCLTGIAIANQLPPPMSRATAVINAPVVKDHQLPSTKHSLLKPPTYPNPVDLRMIALIRSMLSRGIEDPRKLSLFRTSKKLSEYLANVKNVRKVADALACVEPLHALQFLRLTHQLRHPVKQNVYETICFRLADLKAWPYILDVVLLGTSHLGCTTVRLLNWKARALLEMERYGPLQDVLDEFNHHNLKPNRRTYHLILSGHIRNCNIVHARHCLQQMEEAGFPPDPSTHALLATNYRSLGSDLRVQDRALKDLNHLDNTTGVSVLNSLIQLRLDSHDIPGALQLLSHFDTTSSQALVHALSGSAVIRGTSKRPVSYTSHPHIPDSFIPNAATYVVIVNHLARHGVIDQISNVLYAMELNGIKATSTIVISLIHTFASAGRLNLAVGLVASICRKQAAYLQSLAPSTLNSQAINWPDCASVRPSTVLFNSLLRSALQVRGLKAMTVVLKVMRNNNVSPDARTLEIFIAYLRKRENIHPRILLRIIRQLVSAEIHPSSRHLHAILACILRYEKFLLYGRGWTVSTTRLSRPALSKSWHSPQQRIKSTANPFDPSAGLRLPRWMRCESLASPIIESLVSSRIMSDAATFALRVRHEAIIESDIDSAEDVFRVLLSRGIHATEYHLSALMEGYALVGDMNRAEAILDSIEEIGLRSNVVMYTILIVGYGRHGKPEKALRTFQQMINSGCKPDVPAIDALCGALYSSGAYVLAKQVLIQCWRHIQPFPEEYRSLSLRELAVRFRSLHRGDYRVSGPMTKSRRRLLHFRVRDLLHVWRSTLKSSTCPKCGPQGISVSNT